MRLGPLLLLLLVALLARDAAAEESRLGTLLRWYLAEPNAARREEILESIREVSGDDPLKVAEAIREGIHFRRPEQPAFRKGGKAPDYSQWRPRVQSVADSAGDFAELLLPVGYDRADAYPLHLDLVPFDLEPSPDVVTVRIDVRRHPQAFASAQAAEMLVLSILAETLDLVHVNAARVYLRAQDARAELASYIVFQNPDRFAGLLAGGSFWKESEELLAHGRYFSSLAVVRRGQEARFRSLTEGLAKLHPGHLALPAGPNADAIAAWFERTASFDAPTEVQLACNRPAAMRAYWLRAAPRERSLRKDVMGGAWSYEGLRIPASITATIDPKEKNLVRVTTDRVNAFWIYVDPAMFDAGQPLRVSVNGSVAAAKYIEHNIAYLLEDYAERRDPRLLYCCRLAFTARGP